MHDVVVVGGGFAGVTAAREAAKDGRSVLLLEGRDRLGGRTWTAPWKGHQIEYGGGWVHWHQPHSFSEITRAGLTVELSDDPDVTAWYVGDDRRTGTIAERDAIANRGWLQFVDGVERSLPNPHDPRLAIEQLERIDRLTIAQRVDELDLDEEHREVLWAELESLAHGPLDEAGAASVLRWHALSGYSLALTQYTGGRVTLTQGTRGLLEAIAGGAAYETRLGTPVAAVRRRGNGLEVETRAGELFSAARAVVAVPLNTLGEIEFSPALSELKLEGIALGQASRGIKIFIHAQGEPISQNAIRPGHPFGYLDTEFMHDDGSQVMIGFGYDAALNETTDLPRVQGDLDRIIPGYRAIDASAHDWLADEFSRGTWAIHRPGWYSRYYEEMRRPEGPVLLAGSDLAAGWSGFIDGAIESGLRAGAWLRQAGP
jgi:pseudooxynicotine oxidase